MFCTFIELIVGFAQCVFSCYSIIMCVCGEQGTTVEHPGAAEVFGGRSVSGRWLMASCCCHCFSALMFILLVR